MVYKINKKESMKIQELFDVLGVKSDHIAIRTSYYSSMGERNDMVQVFGLSYLIKKLESETETEE